MIRTFALVVLLASSSVAQNLWTQLTVATGPGPRWGHAMAYDAARNVTVLFGGYRDPGIYFDDTWTFNGTSWQQVNLTGPRPSPRIDAAMCYDSARQLLVLLGGSGMNDSWVWNGTNWAPSGAPATFQGEYSMAFDSLRNVTVAYNGGRTLEWAGSGPWIDRQPATTPSGGRGAMVFDALAGKCVLFAGGQTWHWNGVNWLQLSPAVNPPSRVLHRMVYETTTGHTILFGGYNGVELNDTWSWNGVTWTQLFSAVVPPIRHSHGMAFDASIQRAVLYGGVNGLSDTWIKNATSSTPATVTPFGSGCSGTAGVPQLSAVFGSQPWIGSTLQVDLQNLPWFPFWAPFGIAGLSNTAWLGAPLPLPLTPIGMTGCQLFVSLDDIIPLVKNGSVARWQLVIPFAPNLIGMHVYMQGALVEPPANPFGMILSNAIDCVIGAI